MNIWSWKISTNLIWFNHIFNKFLCSRIKFIHVHIKMCVAAQVLEYMRFLTFFFFGFPIKFWFRKGGLLVYWTISKKWCIFDFFATFCDLDLEPCFMKKIDMWINKSPNPIGNYIFKVNNRNTRARCEICSKFIIKTPERCQWRQRHSVVFIVNFEHISHLVLVTLLLTLRR